VTVAVTLTAAELQLVAHVGIARAAHAIAVKAHQPHGEPPDRWLADIGGAAAEYVVARHLGRAWVAIPENGHGGPDVIGRDGDAPIDVRWSPSPRGSLIVHRQDPPDWAYVLVVGALPSLTIVGGIRGALAQRPEHWFEAAPRPAYFVPQDALRPLVGREAAP